MSRHRNGTSDATGRTGITLADQLKAKGENDLVERLEAKVRREQDQARKPPPSPSAPASPPRSLAPSSMQRIPKSKRKHPHKKPSGAVMTPAPGKRPIEPPIVEGGHVPTRPPSRSPGREPAPPQAPPQELLHATIRTQQENAARAVDVSDSEREAYRRMLPRRPPDRQAGTPLDVVIGLDFGTSGTKVVMRAPFAAGDQTWALPVPGWARDGHPDVWASRMWLDARGVISLVPMHGAVPVCGIKNAIMRGRTDAGDSWTCGPVTLTPPEATTAFLALMLRAARSFFSREVASGMRGGPLRWQVNAGLPAARCEPGPMLSAYRRALAAAFVLSDRCEETTDLRELRGALTDPDVLACAEQMAHPGQTPLAIIPEVAAEVAGLARANSLMPGLNVLVDVGCGTLDICSFRRNEDAEGGLNWPILLASVRLLGSGALAACANEADRRGLAVSVRTQAMEIIHGTRRRRDRNAACWQADKRLPVLLAGGGAASDLHLGVVRSLDDWLRQHVHNGGTRLILVGEPSGLKARCAAHEAHRLSVAWGLSLPASDIGRIVQPNEIEDMSEPTRREQDDRDSTR